MRSFAVCLLLSSAFAVVAGCSGSSAPGKLPTAVAIEGTVTGADGKPVGDVMLMLQPTSSGFMVGCEVGSDGRFSGEAVPGTYAWFIDRSAKATNAEKAIGAVPETYRSGSLDRKVTVRGGSGVEITLK